MCRINEKHMHGWIKHGNIETAVYNCHIVILIIFIYNSLLIFLR